MRVDGPGRGLDAWPNCPRDLAAGGIAHHRHATLWAARSRPNLGLDGEVPGGTGGSKSAHAPAIIDNANPEGDGI